MIADQHIRAQVLDVTQSFLVQAPAGSGKTSLLVQRYLSLLARVEQAPEEILALTFTRKAAAEMRDRILAALELGLQAMPSANQYLLGIWQLAQLVLARDRAMGWELLNNPARLKIQTIDALCAGITKQMPIVAQFGAQPQIEARPDDLYALAVDRLLQDIAWQPQLNIILQHLDNDWEKTKQLLVSMLKIREQWLPIVVNTLTQQDIRLVLEDGLQIISQQAMLNLYAVIPAALDFNLLAITSPETIEDWLSIANILLTQDLEWRKTVTEKQGFPAPSKAKNKQEAEQLRANKQAMLMMLENLSACETFKQHLITITKVPPTTYTEMQWQVLDALAIVLRVLAAHLITVFKDAGQVDFTQVTISALHTLRAQDLHADLALALDCKIQHILVDEFQDTSISQFDLLQQLTINWEVSDGRTLFLVGDPMQSVYRFRKAEVSLFLQAKKFGINNIKLKFLQLTVNFRSVTQIVDWVNKVFVQSFPKQDDMVYGAISYMPAQAAKLAVEQDLAVSCFALDQQAETAKIIAIIQQAKLMQPDKTIAILVRAKSHLTDILPALRTAEIVYQGVELESLKQRPLIQDLLALTRAILHLDDRIAWLAILRAPWCGLSLSDLHVMAQTRVTIWQTLQDPQICMLLSPEGQARVTRLVAVLQASLKQRGRQSIDIQIQAAWEALGGRLCLNANNTSQEAEAYFNLLADLATKRELLNPEFIEQQLENLYLPADATDLNAVQIMTMHKAKGLEFDIVLLPSLTKSTRGDEEKLLLIEQRNLPYEHLLLAPIKAATEQHDPIYKYLAWSEKQRQAHEELRLLYVAATRARQQLYCFADVATTSPASNSLLANIWPAVANDFINTNTVPLIELQKSHSLLSRLPKAWFVDNVYLPPHIETIEQQLDTWQQDWVRLVGIVVHRIFYVIATTSLEHPIVSNRKFWELYLMHLGLPPAYLSQALEVIAQALTNTLNDPIGKNILSTQHVEAYAEWALTMRYGQEFKQVVIDRAFVDQVGVFWIVDYKILHDSAELPLAIERYAAQLARYASVLKNLRPKVRIKTGLYFPLQTFWHEFL